MSEDLSNDQAEEIEQNRIIDEAKQAVMAEISGAELPTPEPEVEEPEVVAEVEETEEVKPDEPATPSLEDQVKFLTDSLAQLRHEKDTANGRFGNEMQEIKRAIDAVKQQGTNGVLSEEQIAGLTEEYPGLAKLLIPTKAEQLESEVTQETEQTAGTTAAEVKEQPKTPEEEKAVRDLTRLHPDWLEVASYHPVAVDGVLTGQVQWANAEFGEWVGKQPMAVQKQLLDAKDAEYLAERITEFKEVSSQSTKANSEPEPEPEPEPKQKSKPDLSKALLPQGNRVSRNVTLSDEQIIEDAKRKTMRQVMNGTD